MWVDFQRSGNVTFRLLPKWAARWRSIHTVAIHHGFHIYLLLCWFHRFLFTKSYHFTSLVSLFCFIASFNVFWAFRVSLFTDMSHNFSHYESLLNGFICFNINKKMLGWIWYACTYLEFVIHTRMVVKKIPYNNVLKFFNVLKNNEVV